ncbi:hypothetical protein CANARDRAFT_7176 [[Candida] arabinofermentans NRRL YB-2248]|uniref:GPI-anchored wall transfer protein n=1 Tax=[Candida] arabinofermentans NRRL YB-2248 TaxID=983967 RepID=A0A1E4T290_9ASCO|nr:hypothetical protein CANARDRAFT_7176 [[Candida] arabinofermentans NRRL YB-2248]
MSSLKERKESFVTDLTGGDTLDIYQITSISLTSYLIWCILKKKSDTFRHENTFIANAIDFMINWNNLLLSVTTYSNKIKSLTLLNILPAVLIIFNKSITTTKKTSDVLNVNLNTIKPSQFLPHKSYITVYRSQMMIITCICILAVDFPIFPRRFAKVETWGTSLMDLGVGSFVFSMGLISSRSYIRQNFTSTYSYSKNLLKSLKNSIPLIILGLIRLISVKSLDYQEHLTEYGLHWNFFFTLSAMPLLSNLLYPLISIFSPFILSLMISIGYEIGLVKYGLLEFIVSSNERIGFIQENKEGLVSLIGYFCIFLNGLGLGSIILPLIPTPNNLFTLNNSKSQIIKKLNSNSLFTLKPLDGLFLTSVFYQLIYFIVDTCYVYGVSRRMTNFLYVIWVSAYNCSFLFGYKLVENFIWGEPNYKIVNDEDDKEKENNDLSNVESIDQVPVTLTAVNNNSLLLFLLANLLTGLINMKFNTLDATISESTKILFGYEAALCLISLILYRLNIVLR